MTKSVGRVTALCRHPVKGFTPERLQSVRLEAGQTFPNDRMFAIENGPSGYDPAAPSFIPKTRFTVLAKQASVAKLVTRYDDQSGEFYVNYPGGEARGYALQSSDGREDLEKDLSDFFDGEFTGPLKVVDGGATHRFTDHHSGQVSLLNLASLSAVSDAVDEPVSADRFRMNIHFEGLEAWEEDKWQPGDKLRVGEAELEFLSPTVRCKATHANPKTGEYDRDMVPELFRHFERNTLGVYALVRVGGTVTVGDTLEHFRS